MLTKSLYSVALKKRIKLRITAKVLKTVDREGGLDEYLLKQEESRVKELGPLGWALRWRLMQTDTVIARFRAEAIAIGLAENLVEQYWPMPKNMTEGQEKESLIAVNSVLEPVEEWDMTGEADTKTL